MIGEKFRGLQISFSSPLHILSLLLSLTPFAIWKISTHSLRLKCHLFFPYLPKASLVLSDHFALNMHLFVYVRLISQWNWVFSYVLVHLGSYNKILQTGWLINTDIYCSQFWRVEVQDQSASMVGWGPSSEYQSIITRQKLLGISLEPFFVRH